MILQALLTGRWLIAFMVLPYALLWARSADSGGVLMALMVVALALFYFASLDEMHVRYLDETRLGLRRERGLVDPEAAGLAKYLFGGTAKVLAFVLLFIQPWIGLLGFVMLTAIWIGSLRTRRWPVKTLWAEVLVPLCVLMLPLIVVGFFADRAIDVSLAQRDQMLGITGGLVSPSVRLATVIGTGMMSCYLLLCAMRDEPADRGVGLVTTVTVLGRTGAGLAFFLIAAATTALTIRGASAVVAYGDTEAELLRMAWPWSIAAFAAVLSMIGVLLTTEHEEPLAVGLWGAGAVAIAVFLNLSVI
ncbi:MAG: hypothetical protein ACF8MJ_09790 [Phycisphaerales bacterium JB050]